MRVKPLIIIFFSLLCLGLTNCSTYFAAVPDQSGKELYLTRTKSFFFGSTSEVLRCYIGVEELFCEKMQITTDLLKAKP